MRTQSKTQCFLCASSSRLKYSDLTDRLFGTEGRWILVECLNPACRLLWLDPMPVPEDMHEAYRNYYTHDPIAADSWIRQAYRALRSAYLVHRFGYRPRSYRKSLYDWLAPSVALMPGLRARFESSVMWLTALPDGKLLEIGCGRGDMLNVLSELGWDARGIDADNEAVRLAHARGLRVEQGMLEQQSYPDETFDAIIMSHVIEHLHDPLGTVKECHRILKRGGRLVLLTPNTDSLGHRLYGRHWLHLDPPRHVHLFNGDTLTTLVKDGGFDKVKCFSVIRDANWTLGASHEIKRCGTYRMGQVSIAARIKGYCLMYLECLLLLFNKKRGEEVVSVAQK